MKKFFKQFVAILVVFGFFWGAYRAPQSQSANYWGKEVGLALLLVPIPFMLWGLVMLLRRYCQRRDDNLNSTNPILTLTKWGVGIGFAILAIYLGAQGFSWVHKIGDEWQRGSGSPQMAASSPQKNEAGLQQPQPQLPSPDPVWPAKGRPHTWAKGESRKTIPPISPTEWSAPIHIPEGAALNFAGSPMNGEMWFWGDSKSTSVWLNHTFRADRFRERWVVVRGAGAFRIAITYPNGLPSSVMPSWYPEGVAVASKEVKNAEDVKTSPASVAQTTATTQPVKVVPPRQLVDLLTIGDLTQFTWAEDTGGEETVVVSATLPLKPIYDKVVVGSEVRRAEVESLIAAIKDGTFDKNTPQAMVVEAMKQIEELDEEFPVYNPRHGEAPESQELQKRVAGLKKFLGREVKVERVFTETRHYTSSGIFLPEGTKFSITYQGARVSFRMKRSLFIPDHPWWECPTTIVVGARPNKLD